MATRDTGDGRGPRKGRDGANRHDPNDPFGLRGKARGFLAAIVEEGPFDSFAERLGDVYLRDKAQDAGAKCAEFFLKLPGARRTLMAMAPQILSYAGQLLGDYVATQWLPGERPREWLKEFAQGFAGRVEEEQKAPTAGPASARTATTPAAPAGPREMSAAEILDKYPDLLRLVEQLYPDADARRPIVERLHRTLNFEHEARLLLTPASAETAYDGLVRTPTQTYADLTGLLSVFYPETEALERITAELRRRVGNLPHLTELIRRVPVVPAAAVEAPDTDEAARMLITAHLPLMTALERLYPVTGERLAAIQRLLPVVTAENIPALIREPGDPGRVPDALRSHPDFAELIGLIGALAEDVAESMAWRTIIEERLRSEAQLAELLPADGAEGRDDVAARLRALPVPSPQLDRALFESRVETLLQLTPPPAAPATPAAAPAGPTDRPPTKAEFEARLLALPPVQPRRMDRQQFESMLVLIEDARSDRMLGTAFRTGLERANALGRQVFGGTDRIGAMLDEGTAFFAELEDDFFGPEPEEEEDEDGGEPPGPGVFDRVGGFFNGIRNWFRRAPAEPTQTPDPQQGGTQ